jgi:hypothetical protein
MPTTNYSFANLYGPGTSSINLTAGTAYTFTITNNSGSSYFVMETPFNYQFDGSTPKNTSGSFSSLTNIAGSNKTNYIAGFVLPTGINSFIFTPATNVDGTTLRLRGTGGITLDVTSGGGPTPIALNWDQISQLWNNITSSWEQPIY